MFSSGHTDLAFETLIANYVSEAHSMPEFGANIKGDQVLKIDPDDLV